jgi:PTS system mannose-specific IIB component
MGMSITNALVERGVLEMVGIIIASHGKMCEGIFQSGSMIFGDQPQVAVCSLMPSEGPDDLRAKVEEAIASFDDQEEILFLVDLFGGTPYNQINGLMKGHEDKWAMVCGLNLGMLVEAYGCRLGMDKAHDIAAHIVGTGRDGVKVLPESLDTAKEEAAPAASNEPTGAIPEGTVLGDGHIKYVLARIDTRLLHGQVATAWTKATQPTRIIAVSDNVAKDALRKQMIEQAAPPGVKANVVPIDKMCKVDKDPRFGSTKALLLFETPQDALKAIEGGVQIKELNLGSMAHSEGKVVCTKAVAMGPDDVKTFEKLRELGVKIVVRKVPADAEENFDAIMKKAKAELGL